MMMQHSPSANSILAADFGTVYTRVVLIDLVDGQYRLATASRVRTTLQPPHNDVITGLGWALINIQESTQRQMMDENGLIIPEENGNGVDELVATSSTGRPLSAVVMGLMPEVSIASAYRALTGTYIKVSAVLSIADQFDLEKQINTVLKSQPDLIFISGGTDGGNTEAVMELIRLAALTVQLVSGDERPMVIYAGNADLVTYAQTVFEEAGLEILIARNVRPELPREELGTARFELARAYSQHMKRQPGGFADIAASTHVGIVPTAQAITNVIRWLTESGTDVLHIDVGSSTSTFIVGAAGGEVSADIHSDLGVGHSIRATLEHLEIEKVLEWLPFEFSEQALWSYAFNKSLAPDTVPQTMHDLFVEQAIAHEIVQLLIKRTRASLSQQDLMARTAFSAVIVAGCVLTETPHPAIAALQILTALEFEGCTDLYMDLYAVLPALGAVAYSNPLATVQVFDNQGLTFLGTTFNATGRPRQGTRPAMRITITLASGRVIEKSLSPGEVWAASIAPGNTVQVDIRLGRGLKIDGKRRIKREVVTGTAGIVFDARGRPLPFIPVRKRAEAYASWWEGVTDGQFTAEDFGTIDAQEKAETEANTPHAHEVRTLQMRIEREYMRAEREASGLEPEEGASKRRGSRRSRRRGRQRQSGKLADLESDSTQSEEIPDLDDFLDQM